MSMVWHGTVTVKAFPKIIQIANNLMLHIKQYKINSFETK